MTQKIAIIGAGLSGLTLADQLSRLFAASDLRITVFDKSRGVGGRMTTRYADPYQFDHGAQYFTARSAPFKAYLDGWMADGIAAQWEADDAREPIYVGAPKMNAVPKALASALDGRAAINLGVQIAAIERHGHCWRLEDKDGADYGSYDWVITATPSPQAAKLLPDAFAGYDALMAAKMLPAFTLMVGIDQAHLPRFSHRRFINEPISQVSVNTAKPGRDSLPSIVIQAENDWAAAHIKMNKDHVTAQLLEVYERLCGADLSGAPHIVIHRWLYANVGTPAGVDFLIDTQHKLAACGDWCIAGRIEAAFTSGYALAARLETVL